VGDAEIARPDNTRLDNAAPNSKGGHRGSGQRDDSSSSSSEDDEDTIPSQAFVSNFKVEKVKTWTTLSTFFTFFLTWHFKKT